VGYAALKDNFLFEWQELNYVELVDEEEEEAK
jgi:hypothetical protein